MKSLSLTLLAVFIFASVYCFADAMITTTEIPFSFIADGKTYPAGIYRFSINDPETIFAINGVKQTTASGVALVATRLGTRTVDTVNLVFDVVGNDHYLSEIHVPNQDGFYFKSATGKHTHVTVKGAKK